MKAVPKSDKNQETQGKESKSVTSSSNPSEMVIENTDNSGKQSHKDYKLILAQLKLQEIAMGND